MILVSGGSLPQTGTLNLNSDSLAATRHLVFDDIMASQLRAARALLDWSQDQIATASGAPKRTIARFERGAIVPRFRIVTALRAASEAAGVEFTNSSRGGIGERVRPAVESPSSRPAPVAFVTIRYRGCAIQVAYDEEGRRRWVITRAGAPARDEREEHGAETNSFQGTVDAAKARIDADEEG